MLPVAYPELVSRGVSKSRKCRWLMKVGVSNGATPILKNNGREGGFRATRKPPWIRHGLRNICVCTFYTQTSSPLTMITVASS